VDLGARTIGLPAFRGVGYSRTVPGKTTAKPSAEIPVAPDSNQQTDALTPAMRQYWEQKRQVADAILLFRMGDFYEMFYDDAQVGARLLGIALTSRDGGRTPLAGIPHHALETYLGKLVAAGCKVAISEQVEDPQHAKGIVRREISRIVTPGTLTDEALLDRQKSNVLAAVWLEPHLAGLAALELSTGQFETQLCAPDEILAELGRLAPAEVLLPGGTGVGQHALAQPLAEQVGCAVTHRPQSEFGAHQAERLLCEQFQTVNLEGFGYAVMDAALQAAGALLAYVRETQMAVTAHLQAPRRRTSGETMTLDPTTLRALEIERTLRTGSREGSLLAAVDETRNPMGARRLRRWLCYPLRAIQSIRRRQQLVAALSQADVARRTLRDALHRISDISRMVGRLGVQRTHPRDLRSLGEGLALLDPIRATLRELQTSGADELADALGGLDELATLLCGALLPNAPATLRDGGIFADDYHPELGRLRALIHEGQRWLADFQAREAARTGIPSLKVAYNKVFGYYLEVTNPHRDRVPTDYFRKQTVKNAERYITDELKQFEAESLSAETRSKALEHELFVALRDELRQHIPALQRAADALGDLDVLAGWAELALRRRYVCPEFVEAPTLQIEDGRHPVVEQTLESDFVPNNTQLAAGERCLAVITGPNMSGKSTYIRQVALLTLLAHCGCWVPAKRMRLGIVDRIFTRVGAADELARGQSTFMVEMVETANILHNATPRSLVILDEVGRGTSTFDGLALAWAISEQLATGCQCRALFATHYHELTELAELVETVFNLNVLVREHEDQVVFLHRIVPGGASHSYGLHVAKLAGIPGGVLERAHAVLCELERTFAREAQRPALAAVQRRRTRQLRLFEEPEEVVIRRLRELAPTDLEAGRALTLLREWRRTLGMDDQAGEVD